jgi:hypothetical protein
MSRAVHDFEEFIVEQDSFSFEFDLSTRLNQFGSIVFGAIEVDKIKSILPTVGHYDWDREKQEFAGIFTTGSKSVNGFRLEWRDLIAKTPFSGYGFSYLLGLEDPFEFYTYGTDNNNPVAEELDFTIEELESMRDRQLGNVLMRKSLIISQPDSLVQ